MPSDHPAIRALIDNPDNWLMGEMPGPNKIGLSSLFRTLKTQIPPAPQTTQKIADAFDSYRRSISSTLKPKGMPQQTWDQLTSLFTNK